MRREPVASNVLRSVGHDPTASTLELEFESGDVYRYFAVPKSVHAALMEAPSKGRFFTDHIRDVYPFVEVSD